MNTEDELYMDLDFDVDPCGYCDEPPTVCTHCKYALLDDKKFGDLEYGVMSRAAAQQIPFADPGGHSALRAGDRIHPCPTCGRENMLTEADVVLGYQCDICADCAEGRIGCSDY